jgi:selenide,water dikinase
VVAIDENTAALLTADFFTPIVDDPFDFGRITAANALSDIYAMGGRPIAALNLLAMPAKLPADVIGAIMRGGAEKVAEAGAFIVGGHTIEDTEPKYGLSVFGTVRPDAIIRNIGAQPGDVLVLTKPVGTGIMTTALKRGLETEESIRPVVESMAHLNRAAAEAMIEVGVHAATDVTGFGLLGHAREMLYGSGCAGALTLEGIPVWDRALDYAADMVCPGRTKDLLAFLEPHVAWGPAGIDWRSTLTDPQTSGGMFIAVAAERADALIAALAARGEDGRVVGHALAGDPGKIEVIA